MVKTTSPLPVESLEHRYKTFYKLKSRSTMNKGLNQIFIIVIFIYFDWNLTGNYF
jgi:hypothetical protein